jgi:hypothetical protein
MFNRLAGSADEMGSFLGFLKEQLDTRERQHTKDINEYNEKVAGLQKQIDKLQITSKQKEDREAA